MSCAVTESHTIHAVTQRATCLKGASSQGVLGLYFFLVPSRRVGGNVKQSWFIMKKAAISSLRYISIGKPGTRPATEKVQKVCV